MAKRKLKPDSFSTRLARLMDQRGMTIRAATDVAGVPKSTIQDWRSGVQPTDFVAVKKLALALGATFSFLLTGEDDGRPSGPATLAEVFKDGGMIFDGVCQVTIKRLVPREKDGDEDDDE